MDFKGATRLFADPDFDGEPVVIYEPKPDESVVPPETLEVPGTGEPEPPPYGPGPTDGLDTPPGSDTGGGSGEGRVKYVIDDVNVRVAVERSPYLDADGKLITEDYRVLLKDDIKKTLQAEFGTMTDFLRRWNSAERKQAVLEQLAEHGVPLEILQQAVANGSELDVFDLVAHVAFDQNRSPAASEQTTSRNVMYSANMVSMPGLCSKHCLINSPTTACKILKMPRC
jgi:type I restriction enzyme R subunit